MGKVFQGILNKISRQDIVYGLLVLIALVGLERFLLSRQTFSPEPGFGGGPIDSRYAELQSHLPSDVWQFGYVCDLTPKAKKQEDEFNYWRLRYQSQYALAPRLLVSVETPTPYVIANLAEPSRLDEVCKRYHLRSVFVSANGVALLERTETP